MTPEISQEKIEFAILGELFDAMDEGRIVRLEECGYERLGITRARWLRSIEMLTEDGFIRGANVIRTKTGPFLPDGWERTIEITRAGIRYLENDAAMVKLRKMENYIR